MRQMGDHGVLASRQKGPTQEGGLLNPAQHCPCLPGPDSTVQTKARIPKPGISAGPTHWQLAEASAACSQLGASPLGIPGCPAHSASKMANFICQARNPEKCSPHMKQLLLPGMWEPPFTK